MLVDYLAWGLLRVPLCLVTLSPSLVESQAFLPMLFGVVPVSRQQRLNPIEFVAMYDRFCLMLPDELVRFAFFQMATVGKGVGEFPRIAVRDPLDPLCSSLHCERCMLSLQISDLIEKFPEFDRACACVVSSLIVALLFQCSS